MDSDRFDRLARELSTIGSRRRVLRRWTGLGLGGLTALLAGSEAGEAQHPGRRLIKRNERQSQKEQKRQRKRREQKRKKKRANPGAGEGGGLGCPDTTWLQYGCHFEFIREHDTRIRCPARTELGGKVLTNCNLADAILDDVYLSGANLQGSDLSRASLTGAVLQRTNLRNVKFVDADLYKADFTNSDVTGVVWKDAQCPANFTVNAGNGTCCGHFDGKDPAAGC